MTLRGKGYNAAIAGLYLGVGLRAGGKNYKEFTVLVDFLRVLGMAFIIFADWNNHPSVLSDAGWDRRALAELVVPSNVLTTCVTVSFEIGEAKLVWDTLDRKELMLREGLGLVAEGTAASLTSSDPSIGSGGDMSGCRKYGSSSFPKARQNTEPPNDGCDWHVMIWRCKGDDVAIAALYLDVGLRAGANNCKESAALVDFLRALGFAFVNLADWNDHLSDLSDAVWDHRALARLVVPGIVQGTCVWLASMEAFLLTTYDVPGDAWPQFTGRGNGVKLRVKPVVPRDPDPIMGGLALDIAVVLQMIKDLKLLVAKRKQDHFNDLKFFVQNRVVHDLQVVFPPGLGSGGRVLVKEKPPGRPGRNLEQLESDLRRLGHMMFSLGG